MDLGLWTSDRPAIPRIYWLSQALTDVPETNTWLSEGEGERLSRLRFTKRRNDWRLGRWTAKRLTCSCLRIPPDAAGLSALEIRAGVDGAPETLHQGMPAPISISISHSAGVSFCVAAHPQVAVGCDLEYIQAHDPNFAEDYFTTEENAFLRRAPEDQHELLVTLIWSAKESALKALREGLRRDTRSVAVNLKPFHEKEEWNVLIVRNAETRRSFHGWWRLCGRRVFTVAADRQTSEPTEVLIS